MDSADRTAVTPGKSRLARTFAKVLNIRAATGVAPVTANQKIQSHEKVKHDRTSNGSQSSYGDDDEKLRHRAAVEAFLSKLFASISTVKASYAQLQFCQSPYDVDGIQAADQMVVLELKTLSELKQCYLKKQFDESSPETTLLLAELKEQKSLLKMYEIMGKKMDSQIKLKDSEITFLKEKLEEANKENKVIEKRLNSSGSLSVPDDLRLSSLNPNHFVPVLRHTIKSVRSFVKLIINEMELAGWDLDASANAIEPGVRYSNSNHRCFAFESFVCRQMFDGFNFRNFSPLTESLPKQPNPNPNRNQQRLCFERFAELKSMKTGEYLARKPKSEFARFCSSKYLQLVHPKMESSLFGNLNQRNLVNSGEFPETTFFAAFGEMAKRVWVLNCLAYSFVPAASIFQVEKGCRFSEVYMESVTDEPPLLPPDGATEIDPVVAFTVVPGFKIGKTVIQCQ
ncbi:hypothetical protein U1Q18_000800, partial [Sarracenia purpurea var. burkii]